MKTFEELYLKLNIIPETFHNDLIKTIQETKIKQQQIRNKFEYQKLWKFYQNIKNSNRYIK